MTALEDRVRQVGRELDRATADYVERAPGATYVNAAPPSARRPAVMVVVGAVVAVCVALLLLMQRSDQQSSTVTEPPDGLAISATLGHLWIWPSEDSGVIATSADQAAREFADRVLRLPDAVVVNETADGGTHPTFVRIETTTMSLRLLVAPQGSPDRWVIHQLNESILSQSAKALEVPTPANASSAELFVRYANSVRAFVLPIDPAGGVIDLPLHDVVSTVIAVFRDSKGEVIDVRGGEFGTVAASTDGVSTDASVDTRPRFIPGAGSAARDIVVVTPPSSR